MKVVLDTNVVIQAAFRPNDSDTLLRQARRGVFEIVTSGALLSELLRVMCKPSIQPRLGWSNTEIENFVEALGEESVIVAPSIRLQVVRDESDNRFLEAALESTADYIVSEDNDLLVLQEFQGIQIVSTARFLAILARQ